MTEATFSSFLNAASIDDTVINNAGGPVGNTNAALQATAAASGLAAATPVTALGAVTANSAALGAALTTLGTDYSSGNYQNAIGDGISAIGDAVGVLGGVVGVIGLPTAAVPLSYAGNFVTAAGIAVDNINFSTAATALNELGIELGDALIGDSTDLTNTFSGIGGTALQDLSSVETGISNAVSSLSTAIQDFGTSAESAAASSLSSAITNLESPLTSLYHDTGETASSITDTVNSNDTFAVTNTGGSTIGGGTISTDSNGNIDGGIATEASGGNISQVETVGSNGIVSTLQSVNSNGSTQYTQTTDISASGQVSATVSGSGDIVNLGSATITLTTGASATVQGNTDITILNQGALSASVQGNSDYISDGNGIAFTSSGVSDTANIGGYALAQATATFSSSTSLDSIKLSNNNVMNVASGSQDTITAGDSTLTANNNSTGNGNVQNTVNWNSGGSQGQYFTLQANGSALPTGVSEEVLNDSGANLTGTLQDGITDLTAGGSIDQIFAGLGSGVSSLFNYYTGANDTGKAYQENVNYTAGNSTVELYTPTGAITNETYDYSASNGTGTDNENITNWSAGGSQEQLFTGLPTNVTAEDFGYSGSNLTGTQQYQETDNAANGQGKIIVDISGSGDVCSLSNVSIVLSNATNCTVTGQDDTITLASGAGGCTVNLDGSSDVANLTGNWNTVDLSASSDTATISGTHETVDSTVSADTINLSGSSGTWDTVSASHDTLNLGTQTDLSLTGSTNTINGSYDVTQFSGTYNALNTSDSVISDLNAVGDWLIGWYDMYDGTNETGYYDGADPLVLNLSGQQVQTTGVAQSGAFFDMENDGQRILTGWATPGEGFLVYDPNNTNSVTNEASLVSSFSALQPLDSNHDGVLNASDAAWANLKVWVDSTGLGNFSSSSLYTLGQLGITSINLNATQESQNSNGNTIVADSSFTFANGNTGDIAGVNFVNAPDITMGVNGAIFQQANSAYNQLVSAMAAAPPASSASVAATASSEYAAAIASLAAPSQVGVTAH